MLAYLHITHPRIVTGVGRVVTTWGLFETYFNGWLEMLLRNPNTNPKHKATLRAFVKRSEAFRDAAEVSFSTEPGLLAILTRLTEDAERLADDRNTLTHGMWMMNPDGGVWVSTTRGKQAFFYTVTPASLVSLDTEISEIHMRFFDIFNVAMVEHYGNPTTPLTSRERSALQSFHKNHVARHVPTQRGPRPRHLPFRG